MAQRFDTPLPTRRPCSLAGAARYSIRYAQTAQGATPETSGAAHFIQIATSSNSFGDYTLLDNAVTNNLPNAVLFVTPNFNPGSISGTYDPHPVGVCYKPGSGRWAILNEDGASMPLSAAFNVLAFAS